MSPPPVKSIGQEGIRMFSNRTKRETPLYIMLLPAFVLTVIFAYTPMFGVVIAFQDYTPAMGFKRSEWVGLDQFRMMLDMPEVARALQNTLYIAGMKLVVALVVPIVIAVLLNEVSQKWFKRSVQTLIYFPHFISWIILGGLFIDLLSRDGLVNQFLGLFGASPTMFLANNDTFPFVLVLTDVWKNFGFGTIVYLAAITSINPSLYEAAVIDGANRWHKIKYITLPGMVPIIVLIATLSIGDILNAGFEQVLTLYGPVVYESGDIIDTLVFRLGLNNTMFSLATAVGLFKSVVSVILISLSYFLAHRYANYRIF